MGGDLSLARGMACAGATTASWAYLFRLIKLLTSVGPLVHDVPLRWPRVSPRVVVRRFHHARDDPPKCQGAAR